MEDSLINYLIDSEYDWDSWSENLKEALAIQVLQEWICSDNFKKKAAYRDISAETSLGRHLLKLTEEDQYWKNPEYVKVRNMVNNIYDYWKSRRWAQEETTKKGRRRTVEYSDRVIAKAMRYVDLPFFIEDSEEDTLFRSGNWSRSILGQSNPQNWVKLVILKENLFSQIYSKTGIEYFTGKTREEIAETLNLSKPFTNELCRWLQDSGNWVIKRRELRGKTRRELCYSVL